MPFINNLSKLTKVVGDSAKIAAKKSGELVEIAKLNMSISSEEDKVKDTYAAMGKMIFDKYEGGEVSDDAMLELYNHVVELKNNIVALKQRIAEIKSARTCDQCGAEIDDNTMFCSKCGAKQKE